jgi:hypothetical protein
VIPWFSLDGRWGQTVVENELRWLRRWRRSICGINYRRRHDPAPAPPTADPHIDVSRLDLRHPRGYSSTLLRLRRLLGFIRGHGGPLLGYDQFFVKLVHAGACEEERIGFVEHKALEGLPRLLVEKYELLSYGTGFFFVTWFVTREMADRFSNSKWHRVARLH